MELQLKNIHGEEYDIRPAMERIRAEQLDVLKGIDAICRRHCIKYYGWFGTLLGAVRHQGFIPWDDDVDLAMLRDDFERFRYYMETELPEGWEVSEHRPTLLCVFNTNTLRLDQDFLEKHHGCPYKTGVDVFCLDRIPKKEADEKLYINLFWMVHGLCINWEVSDKDERWKDKNKWEYLEEIEELSGFHFERQLPIKKQLYYLGDRIAAMYWDVEYDHMTNASWMYEHPNYRIPKSCFDKIVEVPFENTMIPIPEDYDRICRMTYGDNYMIPVKGGTHDYLRKQVDYLRKYFEEKGEALPEEFNLVFE